MNAAQGPAASDGGESAGGARPGRRTLVVGGGVAGSTVALSLAERGLDVTLIDDAAPGAATPASAGMLAAQWEVSEPDALFHLGRRGRELHRTLTERVEKLARRRLALDRGGMLVANRDSDEDRAARESAEWQRREGLRVRVLDPGEARELQPGLASGPVSWLWLPDEGWLDTQALGRALPAALAAAGVQRLSDTVERVRIGARAVSGVELPSGRSLDAERVVLAAGAWTGRLEGLPRRVPVGPARGQILRYPPGSAGLSTIVSGHGGSYLVPRPDGSVLAGSTMEDVGFEVEVTDSGRRSVRSAAAALVPDLEGAEPVEAWAGLRPITPDHLPILGPDPEAGGLFYATGYGRNGILVAPAAAEIVADLVAGRTPATDWRPFSVERFEAGVGAGS